MTKLEITLQRLRLNRAYLVFKIYVVLHYSSMVSGRPHKILHHNLLLRQTAIKLKGMEEVKKMREREKR